MPVEPRQRRSPETILQADLRADTRAQAGDRERLARMVGGAMAATTGIAALWLLLRALLSTKVVVIAVATAAATAATAWVISRPPPATIASTTRAIDVEPAPARGDRALEPVATLPAVAPRPTHTLTESPAPEPAPPATAKRAEPRAPASADAPPPTIAAPSADALLERAAIARHGGHTDEAIALYREIAHHFPGSREDAVGCVALGRMLLTDAPADALAAFDRCLADHPRGQLVEAALVGRADALGRLRRDADARAAWSELVRRVPDSLHAPRARARIAASE